MHKILKTMIQVILSVMAFASIALIVIFRDEIELKFQIMGLLGALVVLIVVVVFALKAPYDIDERDVFFDEDLDQALILNTLVTPATKPTEDILETQVEKELTQEIPVIKATIPESTAVVMQEDKEETISSYTFNAQMNAVHLDNLVRLISKMEDDNQLVYPKKSSENLNDKVYPFEYKRLEVVSLIKTRHNSYKIMGGMSTQDLYELGFVPDDHFNDVSRYYPQSHGILAQIKGGKYESSSDLESVSKFEPYTLSLKLML